MKKLYLNLLICLFFQSCATFNVQLPKKSSEENSNTKQEIEHTVYLIGDAGELGASNTLNTFKDELQNADTNSTVLFLGDNIYPKGLPKEKSKNRSLAEERLNKQISAVKDFKGRTIFIPGNHDWYSNGVKGLKREEKYIEDALGKNTFLPENGCPIKKVTISDDIVLLVVDSQWYITNWNKQPTINDDCEIKTRQLFLDEFRSEIKKARGKTTLVALHHPMYTYGPHGAKYSFSDHMKPLPVLGTIKNIIRSTSGASNTDITNRNYNDLRNNLITAAQQNENVIFLSGHDHSLQYIATNNTTQIVSGSGSKTTAVKMEGNTNFGAGVKGYAVLKIYKDQSSEVKFVSSETGKVIFNKQLHDKKIDAKFGPYATSFNKTQKASIYTQEETQKSKFYKFLWGERYRDEHSTMVEVPTANLDTLFGGLKPFRKGGGNQSKSLHLKNTKGQRYVMRAMKKQAVQFIQAAVLPSQDITGQFDDTTSEELIEDIFAGSYPYAPLVVAKMSEELDIYHLNPTLYYVPKQNAMGAYNSDFGDELYIIEEHPSEGHKNLASGNFTGDFVSTYDMLKNIHKDESRVIDEKEFAKVRLFDMLIGDADRHQDQWRWLEFKENGKKVYKPLARDRDLAFSKMSDGFLFGATVALLPTARKFRKYEPDLKDVKGFNLSGYPLDMAFLTDIEKNVWDEQVKYLQNTLTDEVIEASFAEVPKEMNKENIEKIKTTLKERRANLQIIADRYYNLITKYAVITATNKDDFIKIEALDDGRVEVSVYRKKKEGITDRFHHKIYNPTKTKEIWVYGLDDEDTFETIGKSKQIKVRLIGGQNNDEYKVANGKNIVIYDYKSKSNTLLNAKKARIRLTDDYATNVYNYQKLKNNTNQIIPTIGSNPDDGFKIGLADTYTVYGFERNPYTSIHKFNAEYFFATNGFDFRYNGEFANVFNNWNFRIDSRITSDNFAINFFGYGNSTPNFEADTDDGLDADLDYNRVKIQYLKVIPSLVWKGFSGGMFTAGLGYENIGVEATDGRFLTSQFNDNDPLFDSQQFLTAISSYQYENRNNATYPTYGIIAQLDLEYRNNLDNDNSYGAIIPSLAFVHKLTTNNKLVLATKLKSQITIGNEFEFYQAASLGANDGLRGYRNQRFTGKHSFYQNIDLRYNFTTLKTSILPVSIGAYGGFDYGRVWVDDTLVLNTSYNANIWNTSYGGGLWFEAVQMLSARVGVFNSDDGMRVSFGLGFDF